MKWGRNKASSHPSLITHVFPISWLSKFKQKEDRSNPVSPMSAISKKGRQLHMASPSSSSLVRWREGRFYSGDDDSYWRLSFGEEADAPAVGLNSVGYNSDDNELEVPVTSKSEVVKKAGREFTWKFNDMVSDIRNSRNLQEQAGAPTGGEFWESRTTNSMKQPSFSFSNSNLGTIEEDSTLEAKNLEESIAFSEKEDEEISSRWKNLKDIKAKEMKSKSEQQRMSVYINRDCQSKRRKSTSGIKSHSRRSTAKTECKIKPLEDIKKAKRMKKKTKERALGDTTIFDSYAVEKSSFNPQRDFRESMIEMIVEKGIERPEELEELLACYLTLNYDEYHDLIVKVFRQVWSELNELYLAAMLQNGCLSDDHQLLP